MAHRYRIAPRSRCSGGMDVHAVISGLFYFKHINANVDGPKGKPTTIYEREKLIMQRLTNTCSVIQ